MLRVLLVYTESIVLQIFPFIIVIHFYITCLTIIYHLLLSTFVLRHVNTARYWQEKNVWAGGAANCLLSLAILHFPPVLFVLPVSHRSAVTPVPPDYTWAQVGPYWWASASLMRCF